MLIESFSGIRGIAEDDLTEACIRRYIESYMAFLGMQTKIVVGCDTRPSSARIKRVMIDSLVTHGAHIIDVGVNTTPAIEHGVRHFEADGGIIITGSHNEPEHNGWKFLQSTGSILSVKDAEQVIQVAKRQQELPHQKGTIEKRQDELYQSYVDYVIDCLGVQACDAIRSKGFTAVLDPNGGTAATVIRELCERLNIRAQLKNMELGNFARRVEPNPESLAYLADDVDESDIGAGWDCDADRVELLIPDSEFARKRGKMVSGQYLLALLVEFILSGYTGENRYVVANDATSDLVRDIAARHDAKMIEVEVGEVNVVDKMYELDAPIGGEGSSSGGIVPPSRCRDGMLSFCQVLALMADRGEALADILQSFPEYHTSRTSVTCTAEQAASLKTDLETYWKEKGADIQKTGGEDGGLKIRLAEGWVWYRVSKTEAGAFRILADAASKGQAEELLERGKDAFHSCIRT